MVDAFAEAGGLACTDITPEGFLFDMVSSYYYTQLNLIRFFRSYVWWLLNVCREDMLSSLIMITSINLLKLLSEKARSTGPPTREFHMCGE